MCGRYTITTIDGLVNELTGLGFDVEPGDVTYAPRDSPARYSLPRYNAAPTQQLPVVVGRPAASSPLATVELMRWGLIPQWAKDPSIGSRLINARSETIPEKSAFRSAFAARRCLVPADGFYEWRRIGKKKQPVYIYRADGKSMAFAGLWERWRKPDHVWTLSFSIITCEPNERISPIHNRMPLVLAPDDYRRWLNPAPLDPNALREVVARSLSADAEVFAFHDVSSRVGSTANDDAALIEEQLPVQASLF